jgi:hypothetical protein
MTQGDRIQIGPCGRRLQLCAAVLLVFVSPAASAYVGPGAGLGILAALFAIVAAVVATIFGLVLWPFRMIAKRRRGKQATPAEEPKSDSDAA